MCAQRQTLAASLESLIVVQQIAILIMMSDYRQNLLELSSLRARLSLSDSITLVHRLGPKNAARFINMVILGVTLAKK